MTNDVMLGGLYLLMAMMLVLGALITRREPMGKMVVMALTWIALFGAGFVVFTFRDDLGYVAQRLRSEATGIPVAEEGNMRIPQAIDGHFYADALVNGHKVRFLVDSGATMTTIGRQTAAAADVTVSDRRDQMVLTGNGPVRVATGRTKSLDIGIISRSDIRVHVADAEGLNVLGMNYLSTLKRWSVEGRWLILEG
ncbi:MAG: TIGR02281 family clan AA aspartic protease [Sphingomicrobium sp.]